MPGPEQHADHARPPIGRSITHRRVRLGTLIAFLSLVAILAFLGFTDFAVPRGVGYRLIMLLVITGNLVWWSFADEAAAALCRRRGVRTVARSIVALVMIALLGPVVKMAATARTPGFDGTPTLAVSAFQLWHMTLVLLLPVVIVLGYAVVIGRATVRWSRTFAPRNSHRLLAGATHGEPADASQGGSVHATSIGQDGFGNGATAYHASRRDHGGAVDRSRRELLKAAGIFAPMALVGGATAWRGRQMGRFAVRRYDLPAPWLPERLRGLTITHVSDLHLGRLYRPAMLPHLVEQANRLDGDLVVVTGDIVDLSNDLLPPAVSALRQLRHRHGMYLCVGNHDLIDDGRAFVNTLRSEGFNLLIDERRSIEIEGERLTIAGLDWAGRGGVGPGRPGHAEHARAMMLGHDAATDGPCIALAHHPHAFDALADAGVPLTLSGHTHGGQLMFRAPRADGIGDPDLDVGVGRMLFRYLRGFYQRGPATLFVNSGVGNWFPIRTNAPAEIVRIRLV